MFETVHTETYKGFKIEIIQNNDAENPFKEWDDLPDIVGWHRSYNFNTRLGDERLTPKEFMEEAKREGYVVFPLYMYDHSGLAFSLGVFGCPWDSGQLGFMFWTKEKLQDTGFVACGDILPKEVNGKPLKEYLTESTQNAVNLLNDYVQGNVYGFQVSKPSGEEVDSCWGFYGDYDQKGGPLEEARRIADFEASPESLPLFQHAARVANNDESEASALCRALLER